jgi:hypothetical protein
MSVAAVVIVARKSEDITLDRPSPEKVRQTRDSTDGIQAITIQ